MFHMNEFFKLLKKYDVTEQNGHLLVENNESRIIRNISRKLLLSLGELRADNSNFRLVKSPSCMFKNCVSPQCYYFKLKLTAENSLLSKEDIIDIANEMDLDRIEELGVDAYLKEYNESLPDILKLSKADFRTIYAYMKGNQK